MKKKLISVSFLLLLIISFYLFSAILCVKSPHGINQIKGLYLQPENTIDVVMMGSSHIHCNINTALLWENYGIASYDYSGAEQPLWMTYHYLKELYQYQTPKIIVLDLFVPAHYQEDYRYNWISENIHGMKLSLNKLEMLSVSVEPDKLLQYFPSFASYHNRYNSLEPEDFHHFFWNKNQQTAFKGYTPYYETRGQERPVITEERRYGLSEKSEEYLRKIIAYTKEHNTELILIATPYVTKDEDKRVYNHAADIAAENNILFIDYNDCYDIIGIDFSTDFNDESHLNYWGSCKFTNYLGLLLCSYPQLPDRRNEAGYESWDRNVESIELELESQP